MEKIAFYLLISYIFFIPLETLAVIEGIGTLTSLIGFILILFYGVVVIQKGRVKSFPLTLIFMVLFLLFSLASYFWSIEPSNTIGRVFAYLQLTISVWLIYEIINNHKQFLTALQFYVLGSTIAALGIIYNYVTVENMRRYTVFDFSINNLALIICLALPIAWYLGFKKSNLISIFNFLTIPIMMMGALLSGSRSVLLSVLIFLLIIPLSFNLREIISFFKLKLSNISTKKVVIILLILISVPYVIDNLPEYTTERTTRVLEFEGSIEDYLGGRYDRFRASLLAFFDHPIMGVGAGSGRFAAEPYLGFVNPPHNVLLVHLSDLGLIGGGLYLIFNISAISNIKYMNAFEKKVWIILLLVLLVPLMSMNWHHNKAYWMILGLFSSRKNVNSI